MSKQHKKHFVSFESFKSLSSAIGDLNLRHDNSPVARSKTYNGHVQQEHNHGRAPGGAGYGSRSRGR